jgi:AcrR family transcriptional regulator
VRADAQRNRDALLTAAVDVFTREGPDVPLDVVSQRAGVGIGTLYRHFPHREALVEAAYRSEVDRLCDAAADLLAEATPDVALRAWMDRFVDYLATKREMKGALQMVIASGGDPFGHSRARLTAAVTLLVESGSRAGVLRPDADPGDVLLALSGVTAVAAGEGQRAQAGRLLDLLVDGLRLGAPGAH